MGGGVKGFLIEVFAGGLLLDYAAPFGSEECHGLGYTTNGREDDPLVDAVNVLCNRTIDQ